MSTMKFEEARIHFLNDVLVAVAVAVVVSFVSFLRPFGPQFGLKITGGAAPLDLSLGKILTDKARVLTSLSRIMDLGLFLVNAKLSKLGLESTG